MSLRSGRAAGRVLRQVVRGEQDRLFLLRGARRKAAGEPPLHAPHWVRIGFEDLKIIFRQEGPLSSGNRYRCRIARADDGNLS